MTSKEHWNRIYGEDGPTGVSWFQSRPATSLRLIESAKLDSRAGLIDVGGGASLLVDCLLDLGFEDLTVLDLSAVALAQARERLGARAARVSWIEVDVTEYAPARRFDLWHDRAVFHFLTGENDRRKYLENLTRAMRPGGAVIIGTFAVDGPVRCSGLEVARYDATSICAVLGRGFQLVEHIQEAHVTPWDTEQRFSWFRFRIEAAVD